MIFLLHLKASSIPALLVFISGWVEKILQKKEKNCLLVKRANGPLFR